MLSKEELDELNIDIDILKDKIRELLKDNKKIDYSAGEKITNAREHCNEYVKQYNTIFSMDNHNTLMEYVLFNPSMILNIDIINNSLNDMAAMCHGEDFVMCIMGLNNEYAEKILHENNLLEARLKVFIDSYNAYVNN